MCPHEIVVAHGNVFDPGAGIGASTRPARRLAPAELVVWMRPSIFLLLASPLAVPRASLNWIRDRLVAGHAVCPPMLRVWMPVREDAVPAVVAHDGRHRALALRELVGDRSVLVTIELPGLAPETEIPGPVIAAMLELRAFIAELPDDKTFAVVADEF